MNRRILFVDDEPSMLRSLRRMLFDLETTWDMQFAESGRDALEILAHEPFDVVVADLKMPGMDGVELLRQVRTVQPGAVRIILSGYSDKSRLIEAASVAHQFLSKPSSPEEIQSAVERIFALQTVFGDQAAREAVTRLDSLPAMPSSHRKLLVELDLETTSLETVGELISLDMGLTASVLKLVNTAFFGLPQHIDDPRRAVTLLGLDILRALVLLEGFFSRFDTHRYPDFALEALWTHSMNTASYAKRIARLEGANKKIEEQAYIGGLLHDIGKLVLAEAFEGKYRRVIALANDRNVPSIEVEQEVLTGSHADIGAYLLGLWGFAEGVVQAVGSHHTLPHGPEMLIVTAVHAANSLDHELMIMNTGYAPHPVDWGYLDHIGKTERYETWREACQDLDEES